MGLEHTSEKQSERKRDAIQNCLRRRRLRVARDAQTCINMRTETHTSQQQGQSVKTKSEATRLPSMGSGAAGQRESYVYSYAISTTLGSGSLFREALPERLLYGRRGMPSSCLAVLSLCSREISLPHKEPSVTVLAFSLLRLPNFRLRSVLAIDWGRHHDEHFSLFSL